MAATLIDYALLFILVVSYTRWSFHSRRNSFQKTIRDVDGNDTPQFLGGPVGFVVANGYGVVMNVIDNTIEYTSPAVDSHVRCHEAYQDLSGRPSMMLSSIARAYRYLYYSAFCLNKKLWFGLDDPAFLLATTAVWWCQIVNLATLYTLVHWIAPRQLYEYKWLVMFTAAALWLVDYASFAQNGKYLAIVREFEGEESKRRRRNRFLVGLYVVGSLVVFLLTVYWRTKFF